MTDIEEKIAKAEEEIRQLQNRKRKLLNQKKDAERKARTHRLIERGALLESLLEKPEQYNNEQIKGLLEIAFQTVQVQEDDEAQAEQFCQRLRERWEEETK